MSVDFSGFGGDELDAAILVNCAIEPGVEPADVVEAVAVLADACDGPPVDYLNRLGFAGDADNYYELGNSCIARVLDTRRGIPITLAVVLIAVARRVGREAQGIGFPGHFLVSVDDQLVDPFAMSPIEKTDCTRWFQGPLTDELFAAASPRDMGMRMLANARGVLAATGQPQRALELLDHQLALMPGHPELLVHQAELWLKMGSTDMARSILADALERTTDDRLVAFIEKRLAALNDRHDVLH